MYFTRRTKKAIARNVVIANEMIKFKWNGDKEDALKCRLRVYFMRRGMRAMYRANDRGQFHFIYVPPPPEPIWTVPFHIIPDFDQEVNLLCDQELSRWYREVFSMLRDHKFNGQKLRDLFPLLYSSFSWMEREHRRWVGYV